MAHTVYLGLGSNLGDRDELLREALRRLRPVIEVTQVSSVYDTAPMLMTDQPRFHNIVVAAATQLDPSSILQAAKHIEVELGRRPGPRYGPRPIDVDILLYDDIVLDTPDLVIPHPRIAERGFVLAPLAEIAPDLDHPVSHESAIQLLRRLGPVDVRPLGPLFEQGG